MSRSAPTHIPQDLTIFTSMPLHVENSSSACSSICAPPLGIPSRLISATIVRSSAKARLLKADIPFIPWETPLCCPIAVSRRRSGFRNTLNSVGDKTDPCWTPVSNVIPPPMPRSCARLTVATA